ncbi:S-methyl-5'-thioadenosine phosphorylase [candidate division KSB3 bacterium]|uniref:S-methyl-5'-thioadenosine phosphorylase n=1 Tax=candidate division KSB3 bacterium TaxID=2044937 RepID=A0A9D5JY53_9BACT|nr:S-methyl-5'-thioadenosine phosphorylase [candidate division KSB3 bacterium]MBD3326447.1 S-methyl-5'-thioadenosine phosphorylase [candidate division KSB3 bacterium]
MSDVKIGVIGGSGLYEIETLTDIEQRKLTTPFGDPSDEYVLGTLEGVRVAFLPRHGRGHRISPSELNFRANIYGFKTLGVEQIISVTAVGSLKEHIHPLEVVVPDQFFDRTRQRVSTFFGDGLVAHIAFADPLCPDLSALIAQTASDQGATVHQGGTYLCMEGPAFSTRAESHVYRQWGMDIIGMTNLQEAKLAREAEICYATMAMVTDYDCWHEEEEAVTVETIIQNLMNNAALAKQVIQALVPKLSRERTCLCANALEYALITDRSMIPEATKQKLEPIVGKYLQ